MPQPNFSANSGAVVTCTAPLTACRGHRGKKDWRTHLLTTERGKPFERASNFATGSGMGAMRQAS